GVELVGKDAYVVKSSGTIYEVQKFNTDQQKTLKYNSFLGKGNDIEGLAYDRANNRLLMACKGYGHFQEDGDKMYKPIYAFSLEGKQVAEKPVFIIELEAVRTFLKAHKTEEEQLDDFDDFFKEKIKSLPFSPSAIAVHPLSGNIYVASSVGKMLMVLDSEGNILHIEKLKKKVHRQPEGMAFESDGTLYISNEGKDGTGSIHQFVPKGVE
ncbi:MAG: SdiA-regulated domain-containing protein, partial [Bacteroidota bacterium]